MGTMTRVYIAGPMSIDPVDFNFPAFDSAERFLHTSYEVVSPAELTRRWFGDPTSAVPPAVRFLPTKEHYPQFLRMDFRALLDCDRIAFLPGWTESKGARLEAAVARWLGILPGVLEFVDGECVLVRWAAESEIFWEGHEVPKDGHQTFRAGPGTLNSAPDAPIQVKVHTERPKVTSENMLRTVDALVSDTRQKEYGHPAANFERMAEFWSTITDHHIEPRLVPLMLIALKMARELSSHVPDSLADIAGYAKTALMAQEYWEAENDF
jgi:hypothetical protein